ncbi:MAG: tRNA glutamyl-Q(34) synthetase GluQRS [Rhodospirillaceae bacterium]|nr:tRNA glutamyl-Q(34) synthetase GluQRS [Rhodospirillaceae bacterium]
MFPAIARDFVAVLITRFAPSPTGLLHLGHVFSAWQAWSLAMARGGRFLLRLEDTDTGRCRREFEQAILEDLAWLGLKWEEPVLRQSAHVERYRAALARLQKLDLVYPCFCTRSEVRREIEAAASAPHGLPEGARDPMGSPIYPGTCRNLPKAERTSRIKRGDAHAWRLDSALAAERSGILTWEDEKAGVVTAEPLTFGDVVLARKGTPTSYHLAVVVDDAFQEISLVVRGDDLFAATHIHRLLQAVLGLPSPVYSHHPLLVDAQGRRFAKRDKDLTIRALRESGVAPVDVVAMTANYLDG